MSVLPKFHQHVKCSTKGDRALDHVYSNIKHVYRATPLPHHLSLPLIPAYTPQGTNPPSTQVIETWPDDAVLQILFCPPGLF